ncbi:MAG: hypothetical protein AAGG68_08120 [Bacteroidota bacterium]
MKLHLILACAFLVVLTACSVTQKAEEAPQTYTMIMDLKEGINPQDIVEKYTDYGLNDLKRISKSKNTWSAKVNFKTEALMQKAMESMKTDKRILSLKMGDDNSNQSSDSTNSKKGTSKLGGRD